jgi:retinol dehydrogenase-12
MHAFTTPPSLDGAHILITGASSGLGFQSLLSLARHSSPALIYLCARTLKKAQQTLAEIELLLPECALETTTIFPLALDLTSFASVRAAAAIVLKNSPRLDILMLNAGIMAAEAGLSLDGYEIQLATNHLSHALLTTLLMPLLYKTANTTASKPRIVSLSSSGHTSSDPLDFKSFTTENTHLTPYGRYFQSKLANVLWVRYMAPLHPDLIFVAVNPGLAQTSLMDSSSGSPGILKFFIKIAYKLLPTVEQAARNQLWAATAAENVVSGEYYDPVGVAGKASEMGQDDKLAKGLGEWTDEELRGAVEAWNAGRVGG